MKLSTVSEVVEQWLMVQNMWMYMEAVFSGGDIVKQLPQVRSRLLASLFRRALTTHTAAALMLAANCQHWDAPAGLPV